MKCQNCGIENSEKNKFCSNCGTTIIKEEGQVSNQSPVPSPKKNSTGLKILAIIIALALVTCGVFLVLSIIKGNDNNTGSGSNTTGGNNKPTSVTKNTQKVGNSKVGYIYVPSDWKEDEMPSGYDDIEMVSYSDASEKNGAVLTREPISEMDIPTDKDALWEDLSTYGATNIEVKNVTISGYNFPKCIIKI